MQNVIPLDLPVDRTVLGRLLDASTMLVDEMAESGDACRSTLRDGGGGKPHGVADLIGSLVGLAWFQQHQLAVVVSLVGRVQDSETTVADVIERARHLGTASPAAIGAAASLVGVMRESDETIIARLLADATASFDANELIAGSMALTASLSLSVADALGLDVGWTHREMIQSATGDKRTASPGEESPSRCARSVSGAIAGSPGRNVRPRCIEKRLGHRTHKS